MKNRKNYCLKRRTKAEFKNIFYLIIPYFVVRIKIFMINLTIYIKK